MKVIVVGLGAIGSAACYHFAKAGHQVVGLDSKHPPHEFGSSFGKARIFRQAYFEDPGYIPLLKQALPMWKELMSEGFPTLFHKTGLLVVSKAANQTSRKILGNAHRFKIPIEHLDNSSLRLRFPQFHIDEDMAGVWEPDAGYLEPENSIKAHLDIAQKHGARLFFHETLISNGVALNGWEESADGVTVTTNKGTHTADFCVFSMGSWSKQFFEQSSIDLSIAVKRAPQFWYKLRSPAPGTGKKLNQYSETAGMPCFAFASKSDFVYGFPANPASGDLVKVASYIPGRDVQDIGHVDQAVLDSESASTDHAVEEYLPGLYPHPEKHHICHYCLTSDESFLIDWLPNSKRALVATGGSGHAFKFSNLLGRLPLDLIESKDSGFEWDFLKFGTRS